VAAGAQDELSSAARAALYLSGTTRIAVPASCVARGTGPAMSKLNMLLSARSGEIKLGEFDCGTQHVLVQLDIALRSGN